MARTLRSAALQIRHIDAGVVVSVGLIALALLWLYASGGLREGDGEPGPAFLPRVVSVALLVVLLAILASETIGRVRGRSGAQSTQERVNRRQVSMVVIMAVYVVILPLAGFIVSTVLLLLVVSKMFGVGGWIKPVIVSIAATGAIYLVFVEILRVPLYSI